jgi:hypothetical protein
MFERVRGFGEAHAGDFPASSLGGQKFAALNAVISELEAHGAAQSSGKGAAQASTGAKRNARERVRELMAAISETAKSMEDAVPGVSGRFRLPRNNGDQALINSARAFVEAATPLKSEFVQREMPATFLNDLTAAITEFEGAVNEQNMNLERRVSATAGISASLERGAKLVRELDPIISNKYRADAATLAAWTSASHIERSPKKNATAKPPSPPAQLKA